MANYKFIKDAKIGSSSGVIELSKATQKQLKELFDLGHPYVQKIEKKSKENDTTEETTITPPQGLD